MQRIAAAVALALLLVPAAEARTAKPPLAVQGGDSQDQNLLQFFLGVVEFGMDVQEARAELQRMGYTLDFQDRTSGPINAIFFDQEHGTFWGGSSNHGEDYGIAW